MRTTLNIDDALLKRAEQLTGISEKTALIWCKSYTDMDEPVKPVVASWVVLSGPSLQSPDRGDKAMLDGESN